MIIHEQYVAILALPSAISIVDFLRLHFTKLINKIHGQSRAAARVRLNIVVVCSSTWSLIWNVGIKLDTNAAYLPNSLAQIIA